jgi:hypothetical protein
VFDVLHWFGLASFAQVTNWLEQHTSSNIFCPQTFLRFLMEYNGAPNTDYFQVPFSYPSDTFLGLMFDPVLPNDTDSLPADVQVFDDDLVNHGNPCDSIQFDIEEINDDLDDIQDETPQDTADDRQTRKRGRKPRNIAFLQKRQRSRRVNEIQEHMQEIARADTTSTLATFMREKPEGLSPLSLIYAT